MWSISDTGNIKMTRGDTPSFKIEVTIQNKNGDAVEYIPKEGDVIIFAVKKNPTDEEYALLKEIPIDTLSLNFLEEDTKSLDFDTYTYEISLNSGDYHCTFVTDKKLKICTELY